MDSTDIVPFNFEDREVRTILIDSALHWVAVDVTKALGLANGRMAVQRLDQDGVSQADVIDSMGRRQTVTILNESALYELVIRSDKPEAIRFRRWITNEVLPQIRRTGAYVHAAPVGDLDVTTIKQLHQAVSVLLEANEDATARAIQAESTVEFIEGSAGLSVRELHKQYFSDVPEKEFNEFLYRKHLLLDQRGARGRDEKGRLKNGKEHRQPTFRGKAFFFLDPTVDRVTGERHYQTKVRPGTPEVELVHYLVGRGLTANGNAPRTLKAVSA